MPGKFRPGQPVTPGTHTASAYSVTVGSNGDITVKPGDWISKYAKCLYGDAMVGWSDFGKLNGGSVSPLPDPGNISVGDTLYHIPTYQQKTGKPPAPLIVHDAMDSILRETWWGLGIKVGGMAWVGGAILGDAWMSNGKNAGNNFNLTFAGAKGGLGVGALPYFTAGNIGLFTALVFNMRNPWQIHGMETNWEFDWNVAIALPFGKMLKFGKAAAKFGPVLRAMKKVAQTKAANALSEATKKLKDAKSLQQVKTIIQAVSKNLKLGPGEWEKIHDGLKTTLQANKELGELDPAKGATPVIIDLPIGAGAELSIFMKQLRMSVSMVSGGSISPASPDAPAK